LAEGKRRSEHCKQKGKTLRLRLTGPVNRGLLVWREKSGQSSAKIWRGQCRYSVVAVLPHRHASPPLRSHKPQIRVFAGSATGMAQKLKAGGG